MTDVRIYDYQYDQLEKERKKAKKEAKKLAKKGQKPVEVVHETLTNILVELLITKNGKQPEVVYKRRYPVVIRDNGVYSQKCIEDKRVYMFKKREQVQVHMRYTLDTGIQITRYKWSGVCDKKQSIDIIFSPDHKMLTFS